jgi:hypothetical protein
MFLNFLEEHAPKTEGLLRMDFLKIYNFFTILFGLMFWLTLVDKGKTDNKTA